MWKITGKLEEEFFFILAIWSISKLHMNVIHFLLLSPSYLIFKFMFLECFSIFI